MKQWLAKKLIRSTVNSLLNKVEDKDKIKETVLKIDKYEDTVKDLMSFLDNTKLALVDGILSEQETDELHEQLNVLLSKLFK